jgi:hypothetical protein
MSAQVRDVDVYGYLSIFKKIEINVRIQAKYDLHVNK